MRCCSQYGILSDRSVSITDTMPLLGHIVGGGYLVNLMEFVVPYTFCFFCDHLVTSQYICFLIHCMYILHNCKNEAGMVDGIFAITIFG
jgi:hypothetical protein